MQDVAGERAEAYAVWDGTGSSGLTSTIIWVIIGSCIGVVVLIALIVGITCWKCKESYTCVNNGG